MDLESTEEVCQAIAMCFSFFKFSFLHVLSLLLCSYRHFLLSQFQLTVLFLLLLMVRIIITKFGHDFENLTIDKYEPEPEPEPEIMEAKTTSSSKEGESISSSSPSSDHTTTQASTTVVKATSNTPPKNTATTDTSSTVQPSSIGNKTSVMKEQNRRRRAADSTNPTTLTKSKEKKWLLMQKKINESMSENVYSGNVSLIDLIFSFPHLMQVPQCTCMYHFDNWLCICYCKLPGIQL